MKLERKLFGVLPGGEDAHLFMLEAGELAFTVTEAGASWASLRVPSRGAGKADVLLGWASFEGYARGENYFGCTVGRYANRIGGAEFGLGGKRYRLFPNDGAHSLHGGRVGFAWRLWKGEGYTTKDGVFVRFEIESPDGDEGYPGNLRAAATYGLTHSGELTARYEAHADAMTPVNLTNHAYFNLAGEGSGTILDHEAALHASRYVEADAALIPTGHLAPVEGTAFDFRKAKPVRRDYAAACGPGGVDAVGTGYDHCFVLDGWKEGALAPCAEVRDPASGRRLTLRTTQPGVQFYTGNFLSGVAGKAGPVYGKNAGFCLETQNFPDAPNRPDFPDPFYGPGRDYREEAVFAFDW